MKETISQITKNSSNNHLFGSPSFHHGSSHFNQDSQIPLGTAVPGACPVDCLNKFYIFLAVVCLLKFSGATGRASNFLVSVRCVEEKDKTVAMGLSLTVMSLFAFIPSPILFGYILGKFRLSCFFFFQRFKRKIFYFICIYQIIYRLHLHRLGKNVQWNWKLLVIRWGHLEIFIKFYSSK